jgi:hypothetical protein
MLKQTYFKQDPTRNSEGFYSDFESNCYHDREGKKRIYCTFHKRTQLKHYDGWFYCKKCTAELNHHDTDDSEPIF